MAVEIGDGIAIDELQGRVTAKEIDHAGAMVQVGLSALGVEAFAQFMLQVLPCGFGVFVDAGLARERIARNPHPATRPSGGSTQASCFFGHDHRQPQVRCGHGRRQAAGA